MLLYYILSYYVLFYYILFYSVILYYVGWGGSVFGVWRFLECREQVLLLLSRRPMSFDAALRPSRSVFFRAASRTHNLM